jgi:hypothetical protein
MRPEDGQELTLAQHAPAPQEAPRTTGGAAQDQPRQRRRGGASEGTHCALLREGGRRNDASWPCDAAGPVELPAPIAGAITRMVAGGQLGIDGRRGKGRIPPSRSVTVIRMVVVHKTAVHTTRIGIASGERAAAAAKHIAVSARGESTRLQRIARVRTEEGCW